MFSTWVARLLQTRDVVQILPRNVVILTAVWFLLSRLQLGFAAGKE
jgi:hypothetical protein